MHETRFKNAFGDNADPWRERHQGHHLRLGIGWKSCVWQSRNVDWFEPAVAPNSQSGGLSLDFAPGIMEFIEHRVHVLGTGTPQPDFASRRRSRDGIGSRFDTVGN